MNRLIMLLLSTHIISGMSHEKLSLRRTVSDSAALPQRNQLTDSNDNSIDPHEFSRVYSSENTQLDSDESEDDELARLARLTENTSASPFNTLRRTHHRIKIPRRPRTHEATYDDIARLIQFNSKAALSEARTLNKAYLESILTQLQQEAATMHAQVGDGVSRVSSLMVNLDERLQGVDTLLNRVKKLLDQEKTLADTYEGTCTRLLTAFQAYKQAVEEKELSAIELLQTLVRNQQELKDKLNTLDRRTIAINYTGEETRNTIHLQRWKENFMSACALVTSLGVLTFIISYCIGGDHAAETMETNASLHTTV